jgi:antitoxin component YwqK of YwqJK toxin-antitoxin module
MKAKILFILLLIIPVLSRAIGTKLKREVKKEFYANGNIKRIVKTRVRRTKQFDLYNFYKRTAVSVIEFSEEGTLSTKQKYITKIGDSGRPCYEIVTIKISYYPNGKIRTCDKWSCDKQKGIYKEYDINGNLLFTRINKRR